MNHSNEEVLLFGIGEELNIPLTAMVTDHCKTSGGVLCSVVVQDLGKAPIHLICFSWLCGEPTAAVALRCYQLSLGRHKVLMRRNIVFDRCQPTGIANGLQSLQADG